MKESTVINARECQLMRFLTASNVFSTLYACMYAFLKGWWENYAAELCLTTHNTHKRHHAPGGIRTCIPIKRAFGDPHLRQRGQWDRLQGLVRQ
jgi:hypothetical protein